MTRRNMAHPIDPPWTDDLDLSWKERGKMLAGSFIALLWVLVVLAAIFIGGASSTP